MTSSKHTFRIVEALDTVAAPVEGELLRERVADADVPCERCGGREWVRVERRAEPQALYTRWKTIACSRCGASHGWSSAGRERPGRRDPADDTLELPPGLPEDHTLADVIRAAPFPVYGAAPGARLARLSFDRERVHAVTTLADGVAVRSFAPYPLFDAQHEARMGVLDVLDDPSVEPQLSHEAATLVRRASRRKAREAADAAPAGLISVRVDAGTVEFVLVTVGDAWAAAGQRDDHAITVVARGVAAADVSLTRL